MTCFREGQPGERVQPGDLIRIERPAGTAPQLAELDWPEAHADHAIHREAYRTERRPQLAMAAFTKHDVVPAIVRRAAGVLDRREPRDTLVELDACLEIPQLLGRRLAEHAHGVLALDDGRGAREAERKLAVRREDDQARAVRIESAGIDPPAVARTRQLEQRLGILAVARGARLGVLVVREMLMLRPSLLG